MEMMTQVQSTKTAAVDSSSSTVQSKTMTKTDFLSLLQNMYPGKADQVNSILTSIGTQHADDVGTQSEDEENPADLMTIDRLLYESMMQQGFDLAQWLIPQDAIPIEDENREELAVVNKSNVGFPSIEAAISTSVQPLFFNMQNNTDVQPTGTLNANAQSSNIARLSEPLHNSDANANESVSHNTIPIDAQYFVMQTSNPTGAVSTDESKKAVLSTANPQALGQATAPSGTLTSVPVDVATIIPATDHKNNLFYDRVRSVQTERLQSLQATGTKETGTSGIHQKMLYENSISEAKKLLSDETKTAAIQTNRTLTDSKSIQADATESDPAESSAKGKDAVGDLFENAVKMVDLPKAEGTTTIQTENDPSRIANKESVLSQVKTGVAAKLSDANNEFVIKLKPEGLGEITVVMSKTSDKIVLNIIASNAQTEKLLSSEISNLRESLRIYNAELQQVTSTETSQLMSEQYSQSYRDGHLDQWYNPQEQRVGYSAYGSSGANSELTDVPSDSIVYVGSSLLNKYI